MSIQGLSESGWVINTDCVNVFSPPKRRNELGELSRCNYAKTFIATSLPVDFLLLCELKYKETFIKDKKEKIKRKKIGKRKIKDSVIILSYNFIYQDEQLHGLAN